MPVRYSVMSAGPSTRRNTEDSDINVTFVLVPYDYSGYTKKDLQDIAKSLGLATSGSKADLIARLNG